MLAEPNEPNDEFQIFGNFVASELRNISNINDARRTQRKLNKLLIDSVDALDSASTVQNNVVIAPSTSTLMEFQVLPDDSGRFCVLDMQGHAIEPLQMTRRADGIHVVNENGQSVEDMLSQRISVMTGPPVEPPVEPPVQQIVENPRPHVSANTRARKAKSSK